ncbi:type I-E CRISPR-associated protein Cas6/Cse3/CasE [Halorhodospira halochloris]|uniref:type I-E CRISPR-associated protein Cas6/Cse3/CasE n=1 Tax=Halorhodospira halochloris TaxID=1052 RepID=UPI001EE96E26|nr:type I-E CRISPR-associated protein Cas6/Cse3/CasE [Halorhodospira halochloris]MCG5549534.1 type I-E CRISPR-associated protein Cas6/Cse3/CasE [Halorhodospira halochloris]
MYLSRVRVVTEGLDPHALSKLLAGNAYGNHQLLWQLFPRHDERPFLFRQELEHESGMEGVVRGMPLFYVLSSVAPFPVPGLLECESKPFEPKLKAGQHLAFRLRANPVVARREEGWQRSRRHDVLMDAKKAAQEEGVEDRLVIQERMEAAAQAWLGNEERSRRLGYRLPVEPQAAGYRQHAYRRKGGEIRFSSIDFQGRLEVTDPERLRCALNEGIGRSRAFGCGMLMVKRVAL